MERWKAVGLRCHLCQLSFQFPLGNNRMVILTSSSSGEDSQDLEKHSTTPRSAMAVLLLADPPSDLCFSFTGHSPLLWPKSLWVSSPSTKLLTLEEAQARTRGHSSSRCVRQQRRWSGRRPRSFTGEIYSQ